MPPTYLWRSHRFARDGVLLKWAHLQWIVDVIIITTTTTAAAIAATAAAALITIIYTAQFL